MDKKNLLFVFENYYFVTFILKGDLLKVLMKICFTVRVLTLLFVKLCVFGWFWMIQNNLVML